MASNSWFSGELLECDITLPDGEIIDAIGSTLLPTLPEVVNNSILFNLVSQLARLNDWKLTETLINPVCTPNSLYPARLHRPTPLLQNHPIASNSQDTSSSQDQSGGNSDTLSASVQYSPTLVTRTVQNTPHKVSSTAPR